MPPSASATTSVGISVTNTANRSPGFVLREAVRTGIALRLLAGAALLFVAGSLIATLVAILMNQQHILRFYPAHILQWLSTGLWVPTVCGSSAILIGSMYPIADQLLLGHLHVTDENNWANITRFLVLFLGMTYATTKLPFDDHVQFSLAFAAMSVLMWYIFDRTWHGFALGLVVAAGGTIAAGLLTMSGAVSFSRADFFGLRSWVPVVFFLSGVCFGAMGRQIAVSSVSAVVQSPSSPSKRISTAYSHTNHTDKASRVLMVSETKQKQL